MEVCDWTTRGCDINCLDQPIIGDCIKEKGGIKKHHDDDGSRRSNERSKSWKEELRCKVFLTNASSPIRKAEMEAEGGGELGAYRRFRMECQGNRI